MSQADQERLTGTLERVLWSDPRSGFAIARLSLEGGKRWVIKGELAGIGEGEALTVTGRFVDDARWGRQFRVETARPVLPTSEAGITRYLANAGVKGVGPKTAERIVARFGVDALQVITEQPERLAEVKGLGRRRGEALSEALAPRLAMGDALVALHALPLSPAQVRRVLATWGEDAVRITRSAPYRLSEVPGLGFVTADRVAQAQGVGAEAAERIDAGIAHALEQLASRGDTAPATPRVERQASALLRCDPSLTEERREALVRAGGLVPVDDGERIASPRMDREERRLARALLDLAASHGAALDDADARLGLAEAQLGFPLEGAQRRAVAAALTGGLLVVTGGPGTGKTTLIRGVLAASAPDGLRIALAAPTGRAARRLAEATGGTAQTVHRLLEVEGHTGRFARNADEPLEADLIIVDEASMLDVRLARSLCEAVPQGGRLLLVGDVDQLPSVGPGAVLHDLITSGVCPVVRLDHVHRQAERSSIVRNAHRVRVGQLPVSDRSAAEGDFFVVPRRDPAAIIATVLEVVQRRLPDRHGFDPVDDIQVLVPTHKGAVGTEALNAALREALLPEAAEVARDLRQGDKVIQLRNDYELDIFNGDVGRVLGPGDGGVKVRFSGERTVTVPDASLGDLRTAYAITVHKSQGSEYPAVVVVLHGQHHVLLQRNLIYTALTRGRRFCCIVGDPAAVERAVRNDRSGARETQLRDLLVAMEAA